MNAYYYFEAVDNEGLTVDNFRERCNMVEFTDHGLLFKNTVNENRVDILAFYTYDSVAGFRRVDKKA